MMNKIESLGTGSGKIVYSTNDCEDILRLSKTETLELFKSFGVILFRGFGVTPMLMKDFSEKFSCSYITDPTKTSVDSVDFVNLVDSGMGVEYPHAELASFPIIRPDVIWFGCKTPVQGGETLFWDGVRIWKEMSKHTKQLFLDKKLKFEYDNVPLDELNRWFYSGETLDDCKQTLDRLVEKFEGFSYHINEDGTIFTKDRDSAVVKTKFGNQYAFCNDVWPTYKYGQQRGEIFEDGSKLPDEVADELQKLYDKFAEEIPWQAGDLVMMDNSRFMHGRREFKDNRRQIFTVLSNLSLD
ncbi:TauD/TfdA family dioxygenase [Scytonema sp. NUACC21]